MSKRLAAKTEGLQETNEEDSEQEEEASSLACNPSLTEVQATTEPSPKCNACMYHQLLIHIQQITQKSLYWLYRFPSHKHITFHNTLSHTSPQLSLRRVSYAKGVSSG